MIKIYKKFLKKRNLKNKLIKSQKGDKYYFGTTSVVLGLFMIEIMLSCYSKVKTKFNF